MIEWMIGAYEKVTGTNLDYLRRLRRRSLAAMLKFFLIPLVGSPNGRHPEAAAVAGLCGTLHDDCGQCLEIGLTLARRAGVSEEVLEAVRRPEALSPDLKLVYDLCQAALQRRPEAQQLACEVEARMGGKVLADVAMQLSLARFYPTFKRALGEATSECLWPEPQL